MSLLDSIKIVYEDDDLLVIDKPSGVLTHRVSKLDDSPTVVSWLVEHYPAIGSVYNQQGQDREWEMMRPGIVHRLDKETSGLMIAAKNQKAFDFLKDLFKERKIKKTYIALVHGHLKDKSGTIDAPIGKYGGKQTTKIVSGRHYLKERAAVTNYRVLQEYNDPDDSVSGQGYSLVQLEPETGRTHQIRVHLKSLGRPIVCDELYGTKKAVCPPELGRLFLHAQKLSFTTPSGQALSIESELPNELERFLGTLPIS